MFNRQNGFHSSWICLFLALSRTGPAVKCCQNVSSRWLFSSSSMWHYRLYAVSIIRLPIAFLWLYQLSNVSHSYVLSAAPALISPTPQLRNAISICPSGYVPYKILWYLSSDELIHIITLPPAEKKQLPSPETPTTDLPVRDSHTHIKCKLCESKAIGQMRCL